MGQRTPDKGKIIAKLLWSELELEADDSPSDRLGIDAHLYGQPVQIKYNRRIVRSGNLYHEIYEKTAGRADQNWRHSPSNAYYYIFITIDNNGYTGYLVTTNELAVKEEGQPLKLIYPNNGVATSMGFLIKLDSISKVTKLINKNKTPLEKNRKEIEEIRRE